MKNYCLSVLALCLFINQQNIAQNVYHVNINNGDDTNDGLLWSSSFKNIQPAIDIAQEGDTILIAAGVYHPTKKIAAEHKDKTPTSERHRSFLITKDIALIGGFPADAINETTRNDRDWLANKTVLSGDMNGDDYEKDWPNKDENALHVVVMLHVSSAMYLDGFYIRGGHAEDDYAPVYVDNTLVQHDCGGGIYAFSKYESSPTLANLVICDNQAGQHGGGFYAYSESGEASPFMTNVTFTGNYADWRGGGLFIDGMIANPALLNVNITGNLTNYDGGGLFCIAEKSTEPVLANVLISGNKAKSGSGAFIIALEEFAAPEIINATICGNKSTSNSRGSGVFISAETQIAVPYIRNSVIWGNRSDQTDNITITGRNGVFTEYENNLIEGNSPGGSNLSGDDNPMFVNPKDADLAPTLNGFGDYRLLPESPLINKGQNSFMFLSVDLDGNTRICGGMIDIGAYEFQDDTSGNEMVSVDQDIWSHEGVLYVKISKNTTTIRIFSINGTLISQFNNVLEGLFSVSTLTAGFYIVTLSTGETAKIIIR